MSYLQRIFRFLLNSERYKKESKNTAKDMGEEEDDKPVLFQISRDARKNAIICAVLEDNEVTDGDDIAALTEDQIVELFPKVGLRNAVTVYRNKVIAKRQLFEAAYRGDTGRLRSMLETRPNDVSAKYYIKYYGEIVESYWENLEERQNGWTPLHFTALTGKEETARMLVRDFKAPVDVLDDENDTPLHVAIRYALTPAHLGVIRFLCEEANADIERQETQYEMTPLSLAVLNDRYEVAEYLLKRGVKVNVKDNAGKTPLWRAYGEKMKQLLIGYGAKE